MMTAEIIWGDSDAYTPDRFEAEYAAEEILRALGLSVSKAVRDKITLYIMNVSGVAERRGYDLGWKHSQDALRS